MCDIILADVWKPVNSTLCFFAFIGSEFYLSVYLYWQVLYFRWINEAQLIRGCFWFSKPLQTAFSSLFRNRY